MFTNTPGLGLLALLSLSALSCVQAQTYSATYLPDNLPDHTEEGQTGTNKCGTGSSQNSTCQNSYINSVEDFCLFAPPKPGPGSLIGNTEQIEVSWCTKSGYGTRLIPPGSVKGAHFVQTPDYVQITGIGDLTSLNIPAGDAGGELDPHGATGNGNPIGGLVFSNAFNNGQLQQLHEWTNFMSATIFCFRACKEGPQAPRLCEHIYDVMGCAWNMPGNYSAGTFENCKGDTGEPMGIYGTSTFHQGQPATPPPHPAPPKSMCTPINTIGGSVPPSPSPSLSTTVLVGKKNLEVRPIAVNKGEIVKRILYTNPDAEFIFCAGDDKTDEDMFRALILFPENEPKASLHPPVSVTQLDTKQTFEPVELAIAASAVFTTAVGVSSKRTLASWHVTTPGEIVEHMLGLVNLHQTEGAKL